MTAEPNRKFCDELEKMQTLRASFRAALLLDDDEEISDEVVLEWARLREEI